MSKDGTLEIAPWIVGAKTARRAVVRLTETPAWIWISTDELTALETLTKDRPDINDWLASQIAGTNSFGFKNATSLLLKLHQAGFIKNANPEALDQLKTLGQNPSTGTTALIQSVKRTLSRVLDIRLIQFQNASIDTSVKTVGKALLSTYLLIGIIAIAAMTGWTVANSLPQIPIEEMVRSPETLLFQIAIMMSLAATLNGLTHFAAMSGLNIRFVGGSLKLTGLCILRLDPDDTDVVMLPHGHQLRYSLLTLASPWIWMMVFLGTSPSTLSFESPRAILAACFAGLGILALCPLYRSPLVKAAEGMVVSNNVLELTRDFLARQLFTGFAKSNGQEDRITSMTTVVFASTALLWLYSVFLAFSSIAVELTPALWNTAMDLGRPTRAFSAAVVLLAVVSLALAPAWKLTEILLQNLLAATSTPVRKARQSILAYQSSGVSPSDAVVQFLRNIPILGQMDDPTMRRLVQVMQLRTVKKGDIIIKQGDAGDSFFIMALGQAQVLRELTGGQTEILDIVEAGDSFGEIALLEKTTRTATVRALTDTKVLALSKRNFDVLFPDGTDDRRLLTAIIRQAKLIVSSQGLSHLAPKQVRELLHYIKPVSFKAGDVLIKQGTEGDDVYLIESGKVEVTKTRDDGFKAQLGRGDLVGLIAVVKKVARTATVTALEDTTALKIDGNTFMRMCRSNIIVATVMADLSQSQMKEGDRLERAS